MVYAYLMFTFSHFPRLFWGCQQGDKDYLDIGPSGDTGDSVPKVLYEKKS